MTMSLSETPACTHDRLARPIPEMLAQAQQHGSDVG